jgi:glutathione S-transferase
MTAIVVRSTKNCPNTARILFALEELDLAYTIELVDDGVLSATFGSPGPLVLDGDASVIEPGAIVRHLVRRTNGTLWPTTLADQAQADRWIELQSRRLSRAVEAKDTQAIARLLTLVDAQVAKGTWFIGEMFTIVDVVYALLATPQARAMLPLPQFPALSAYLDRVAARPAWARAIQRYKESLS